jgi:resuscitation-promoting factor RpfB
MRMFSKLMPASTLKLVISCVGVLALVLLSGFTLFEATKAEVVFIEDGKEKTVKTHKNTIGELLADLDINVGEHDHLSHNIDDPIKNGMEINYIKAKQVFVTIDGEQKEYYTTAATIDEFLKENKLSFQEQDDVSYTEGDAIEDGLHITVNQAFQITINDGGKEKRIWTTGGTVADLLEKAKVEYAKDSADKVKPALDEKVMENMTVTVVRVEKEKDSVMEKLAFSTEEKEDSSLAQGETRVLSEGKDGKVKKVYEIIKENGKEVSRELINEEIIEESKSRVVAIGAKEPKQEQNLVTLSNKKPTSDNNDASSSETNTDTGKTFTMTASAYSSTCNGCSGLTATGINLKANPNMKVIAVDPSVIPLGSKVRVEGYGEAIASDTGGHIVGNRIDVHVPSKQAAYSWGVKTVTVKILN